MPSSLTTPPARRPRIVSLGACSLIALCCAACQRGVHGSAARTSGYAPPIVSAAQVRFVCQRDPSGGAQLGVVRSAGSPGKLFEIVEEFAEEVSKIGGNVAKVDHVSTRFEIVTRTESYSYSCGTNNQTCHGTRTVSSEIGTTQMVGRAFRVEP